MASLIKTLAKCTIALSVLCAAAFAQPKPKAAVYIMGNPEGRDALRSAVNTFLIKSGKYQMIAVDAIDIVAQEQQRQMSGSVSDGDIAALGRDAGAQYVCVVQRSELDGVSYVATRMVSVQSKVAEMADIVELPYGGKVIDIIQWQIGSMLGMAVGPRPTGSAGSGSGYAGAPARPAYAPPAQAAAAGSGAGGPPIQGTVVPGGSLAQKLEWLKKSADSHETYIIEANADESISPYTFEFSGGINIKVVLRGVGGNRTIRLSSHGTMFTVKKEVTFVLDNYITLMGHDGNTGKMVHVENGGKLKINNGVTITGNSGGGVGLSEGSLEMTGGTISNNGRSKDLNGGGIHIYGGTVTMIGGILSGNTASKGGGVYAVNGGKFTMTGGIISGNNASNGGGVCVDYSFGAAGAFTMRGGTISGNTAGKSGGGVGRGQYGDFSKTGGIITGYKNDPTNGNVVKDEDNNVLARKGHAVYINENYRKETTAGPGANMSTGDAILRGINGAWDQ